MKADFSIRNNKTIVRYLDVENNQITSGQTILNFKYSADYAFSQNLTGIFYFYYFFLYPPIKSEYWSGLSNSSQSLIFETLSFIIHPFE